MNTNYEKRIFKVEDGFRAIVYEVKGSSICECKEFDHAFAMTDDFAEKLADDFIFGKKSKEKEEERKQLAIKENAKEHAETLFFAAKTLLAFCHKENDRSSANYSLEVIAPEIFVSIKDLINSIEKQNE